MKTFDKLIDKYTYRVEWSKEDETHIAHCLEFPSLVAHGDTTEKALSEIKHVVLASVKWMKDENEKIPEPIGEIEFSGKYLFRMGKEKHRQLTIESQELGMSLNQLLLTKVSK
jgi:predicted RNase H-like HicB family nuclease